MVDKKIFIRQRITRAANIYSGGFGGYDMLIAGRR
jgi:hypothetical protein